MVNYICTDIRVSHYADGKDAFIMKKEIRKENIIDTTNTWESFKMFIGRCILFVVSYLFLFELNICLDMKIYGDIYFSIFEELINVVIALTLSTILFNIFCVEETIEYEEGE